MTTEVTRSDHNSRYEITVDGALAGFADFRLGEGRIVFTHTEIAKEYEGRGLGSVLAEQALTDAAERDEVIVPLCPFIARYLRRHDIPGATVEWPEDS